MERREIEIFLVLAEELHFGRTAERVPVSQARVSQTIQKLERQVGGPLFRRTSRSVALTPLGEVLRDGLAPAQRQVDRAIARAVAAGRSARGVLTLAFEAPGVADLAAGLLDGLDHEVVVREADFRDPFAIIRSAAADALVTVGPVDEPGITVGPVLADEPVVLAVPAGHPLGRRRSVELEDLGEETVLRAARPPAPFWLPPGQPWVTPAGRPVVRGAAAQTFQEVVAVVAAGGGVCPLGAHAATYSSHPRIVFVPFHGAPRMEWVLVWVEGQAPPAVHELAERLHGVRAPRPRGGR